MMSWLRHLLSVLALPFLVTVIVPVEIVRRTGGQPGWSLMVAVVGVGMIAAGLALVIWTNGLFARIGKGTLAPWDPPRHLVVEGPYRHVRNPMILGVLAILLGEALVFGSSSLLAWFGIFALANFIYMPLLEEPMLARRFGDEYAVYKRNVMAWLPRLSPWAPPRSNERV